MKHINYLLLLISIICFESCEKSKFLDELPNSSLIVPSTIEDAQALLDNNILMNGQPGYGVTPFLGHASSDDYYVIGSNTFVTEFNHPFYKSLYTWKDDLYADQMVMFPSDWQFGYRTILYSNLALEVLAKISPKPNEVQAFNNVRGSGLFFRAFSFFQLAQVFAPQFDSTTSTNQLGIPLKLSADISEKVDRANLKQTYNKIVEDLIEASTLLPDNSALLNRPSKAAAFGLLSRIYLQMEDFQRSLNYANLCLQLKNALLDFNPPSIPNPNASNPMPSPEVNPEIIFYSLMNRNVVGDFLARFSARVDSNLIASYDLNDIRKTAYFRDAAVLGRPGDRGFFFRGSLSKSNDLFTGITTAEIYLVRSECYARLGNISEAMNDLNKVVKKRWKNSVTYNDISAVTSQDALSKILVERRKELVMRGLRWSDLKRLNKEGANISITRKMLGQTYILPPNDLRYVQLIPPQVLQFNPGMQQNPR